MFKIPMQFLILFIGILLYVVYVFGAAPAFFNPTTLAEARQAEPAAMARVEESFATQHAARREAAEKWVDARGTDEEGAARERFAERDRDVKEARKETKTVIQELVPGAETQDADFVFITFVLSMLPIGMVGLLIAVILSAAMSSIASELSALATTSAIDLYGRLCRQTPSGADQVRVTKRLTAVWGLVALGFASVANLFDNLIEAVNVLGSLFYGTVLGVFLVAFFIKWVGSRAVFWAAIVGEATVLTSFVATNLGFLWFNVIGCATTVVIAMLFEQLLPRLGRNPTHVV
jgi:Na+(H+)/acetate symporter ActP